MIPARQCSRVDLPEPLGPITATASVRPIATSTPARATVVPNRLTSPRPVSTGSFVSAVALIPDTLAEPPRAADRPTGGNRAAGIGRKSEGPGRNSEGPGRNHEAGPSRGPGPDGRPRQRGRLSSAQAMRPPESPALRVSASGPPLPSTR